MKAQIFAFLLSGFAACLSCDFAWGDNNEWRETVNIDGVKGKSIAGNSDGRGGGIAGGCDEKSLGKSCKIQGVKDGVCGNVGTAENKKPSCIAKSCEEGYLLELYSNRSSKGICRTEKYAWDWCKEISNGQKCSDGQDSVPMLVQNPNNSEDKRAYVKECFCPNKNRIVYNCGDGGDGEPPVDTGGYTNIDILTVAERGGCTKSGAEFLSWNCDGDTRMPGDVIEIEKETTCVAQWSMNEYTVTYNCDEGAEGTIEARTVSYNTVLPLPGFEDGCTKDRSILVGWSCNNQEVEDELIVTEVTTCIARWQYCDECNPGEGCTCELKVEGNQCKYDTGVKDSSYSIVAETSNTAEPRCTKEENNECTDKNKHWDESRHECVCNEGEPDENDNCVKPVKEEPVKTPCPDGIATGSHPNCKCTDEDRVYNTKTKACDCKAGFREENGKCVNNLDKLKQAYEDAKANEQSLANRTLTAASIAATGVGGMELAMGLAEQKAAKAADQDMTAYIESFRCTYGKDKSVKGGPDEIELPGGNDANMIKYRNEYMTLAADLKVRKEALEMKPGIESEEILDKSQMGLYDQENTGIESGAYASLYRAKALNSEEDQAKLDEEAKKAKARVIGGATAVGVGIVGGMIGNSLINGKLGEKIKEKNKNIDTSETISVLDKNTTVETLSNEELEQLYKELEERYKKRNISIK